MRLMHMHKLETCYQWYRVKGQLGSIKVTKYQLLFNIKNTMTDRGPTSKGWSKDLKYGTKTFSKKMCYPAMNINWTHQSRSLLL